MPLKLDDISKIFVGLQTSADTVFLFKDCPLQEDPITTVWSKELEKNVNIETNFLNMWYEAGKLVDIGQNQLHWFCSRMI